MNVVFTGGGTGGHLYPAIAIADALRARGDARISFVGTADRLEATIVPKAGYPLRTVHGRPLARKLSFSIVTTALANARGVVESLGVLSTLQPDIVIATGGYVALPVVVAARLLRALRRSRARIALLEPNALPGLTNRVLAPLVDEIWGAFPGGDARIAKKFVQTGIPVRATLRALPSRADALSRLGLDPARRTLLAMGGSQGARSINDALIALLRSDGLPAGWQLIHVTGEREYDRVRTELSREAATVRPYLDDLSDAYAAADLVLARAGASTIGELVATGRPAILVPYPHAAEDHQQHNAAVLADAGAALIVGDRELAAGRLRGVLASVAAERLSTMREAAQRLSSAEPVATILARIDAMTTRKTAP